MNGNIIAVGQNEIPPIVGVVGAVIIMVGARVAVGKVGVNVGIKVGTVGVKVGTVGTLGTISGVGQNEMPPKVGVVGTGGIKVGTVGVKVGKVGVNVGVKVGTVGTLGTISGVGQNEMPPKVGVVGTGAVMVGVKVGTIRAVIPGAIPGTGAVVTVETGGKITAKPVDEIKIKTVIINKLIKNN